MTSDELKYAVMQYWRFKRQALYIATEVGGYTPNIKDVLMVCGKSIVEVECKVSASDFLADFKKRKHFYYAEGVEYYNTPNRLYYAVPHDLAINESVFDQFPKYGLLRVCKHDRFAGEYVVKFTRKAQEIKTQQSQGERMKDAHDVIFKRMASEIINVHRRMLAN